MCINKQLCIDIVLKSPENVLPELITLLTHLKVPLPSIKQDFVKQFHIFLFHQFVGVNP